MRWNDITLFSFVWEFAKAADESARSLFPLSPSRCRHMDLRDACCFAFNQGRRSNKAGEQKHVTICHMPLGHKLSSRYTLGYVRPRGSAAAASLRQVSSCPMLSPWDQPPKCPQSLVWDDVTCDPPIWRDRDGCLASITLRKQADDREAHMGTGVPPVESKPQSPRYAPLLYLFIHSCIGALPLSFCMEQGHSPATPGKVNQSLAER